MRRIESDGRIPSDNPFVGRPGARPEIWSYGHRNAQGAALNPATGELWADENCSRPVITFGAEYGNGAKIGEGTANARMEQPSTCWVPSIATRRLAFLTSDHYPAGKAAPSSAR